MADAFAHSDGVTAPATRAAVVAPHDTTLLPDVPKALYVGQGGDLMLVGSDGAAVRFRQVPTGTLLPFRARGVRATGTSATDIVALY